MKAHRKEDREFAWIFGVLTLFGVWLVSIAWRMLRGVREMDKIALQLGLPSSHYDALYWIVVGGWGLLITGFCAWGCIRSIHRYRTRELRPRNGDVDVFDPLVR